MQGDEKLPSLKSLQAEQQRLLEEQQHLYAERARLKKEAKMIDTMKANVDDFLSPTLVTERDKIKSSELECLTKSLSKIKTGSGFSLSMTLQELEIIFEFSEHRIEKSED